MIGHRRPFTVIDAARILARHRVVGRRAGRGVYPSAIPRDMKFGLVPRLRPLPTTADRTVTPEVAGSRDNCNCLALTAACAVRNHEAQLVEARPSAEERQGRAQVRGAGPTALRAVQGCLRPQSRSRAISLFVLPAPTNDRISSSRGDTRESPGVRAARSVLEVRALPCALTTTAELGGRGRLASFLRPVWAEGRGPRCARRGDLPPSDRGSTATGIPTFCSRFRRRLVSIPSR